MVFFRLIIMIAVAGLGLCVALFLFSRDRKYLGYAGQILKIGIIVLLVVSTLFIIERLF
jgi:branched-subunit amino acid transport protein AzlD